MLPHAAVEGKIVGLSELSHGVKVERIPEIKDESCGTGAVHDGRARVNAVPEPH